MSGKPKIARANVRPALRVSIPASLPGASPEVMEFLRKLTEATNAAVLAASRDATHRADDVSALADSDATSEIFTTNQTARAGQFLRISPPSSSGLALLLPSPSNTHPGDTITVSLENPLGDLRVSCVPIQSQRAGRAAQVTAGTVNGESRATFTTGGLITFTSNGATHWTTQAEHPAESATITLESIRATVVEQAGSIGWGTVLGVDRRSRNHSPLIDRGQFIGFGDVSGLPSSGQLRSAANFEAAVSGSFALNATDAVDLNSTADVVNVSGSTGVNITAGGDAIIAATGIFEVTSTDAHLHPTGALHAGHEGTTASIHQGCLGTWDSVCADFSLQTSATVNVSAGTSIAWSTAASQRLSFDSAGKWTIGGVGGSSGQFVKHQGAANPTWATFALTDLPSQAADTFLGNVSGVAATPTAIALSALAGTGLAFSSHAFSIDASALAGAGLSSFGSVLFVGAGDGITVAADTVAVDATAIAGAGLENDGANNLRIAAAAAGAGLTGGAGSALAVGSSTSIIVGANDVQRAALTGAVTASQNSNATAFGAAAAKSVLANATNASAVPAFLAGSAAFQYLRVNSANNALEWATLSNHASTSIVYTSNTFVRAALTGAVTASQNSNATVFGAAADGAGLAGGGTGTLSVNVDESRHIEINADFGDYVGFKKSESRVIVYDEFFLTSSGSSAASSFINTTESQWTMVPSGTVTWTAAGSQGKPGLGQFQTGAVNGNSCVLYFGSGSADNFHFHDLEEVSACFSVSSTSSILWEFGWVSSTTGFANFSYLSGTLTVTTNDGTSTTSTPAISAPTTQHEYKIVYTGTSVQFYQGATLLATHTTHIPNSLGQFYFQVQTKTASTRSMNIDYFSLSSINLARGT